ncbi:MAG: hypothetical protein KBT40_03470 [bacterium]|nr:hypothetical protein [Candidatus Minthenecus merdequi]
MKKAFFLVVISFLSFALRAQVSAVDVLAIPNDKEHKVVVHHSDHIEEIVQASFEQPAHGTTIDGFRLQVFYGNKGSVSRTRAYEIKEEIESGSYKLDVYVIYSVPFWRVQVGNCLTRAEANELRKDFLERFPKYAAEAYVVPVKIQR